MTFLIQHILFKSQKHFVSREEISESRIQTSVHCVLNMCGAYHFSVRIIDSNNASHKCYICIQFYF